jgi:hypothetical protein
MSVNPIVLYLFTDGTSVSRQTEHARQLKAFVPLITVGGSLTLTSCHSLASFDIQISVQMLVHLNCAFP